jgi:hypothetical protein
MTLVQERVRWLDGLSPPVMAEAALVVGAFAEDLSESRL